MSIFKIKITKLIDVRNWKVKNIYSTRIPKPCKQCGKLIGIDDPAAAFSKRTIRTDGLVTWITYYTHTGPCKASFGSKLKAKI